MSIWARPVPSTLAEAEAFALEYVPTVGLAGSGDDVAVDLEMILSTELARTQPELAWHVITRAVEIVSQKEAGLIGAGALENLLSWHPNEFLPRAEELALRSRNFAEALENVWQFDMPDDQWARLEKFRAANRHLWERSGGAA